MRWVSSVGILKQADRDTVSGAGTEAQENPQQAIFYQGALVPHNFRSSVGCYLSRSGNKSWQSCGMHVRVSKQTKLMMHSGWLMHRYQLM